MHTIARVFSEIRTSTRQRGISGTIARCLAEPFYRFRDRRFDSRFHVETEGIVDIQNLDFPDADRQHASVYQPVRLHAFSELMRVLKIRHEDFTFVDFGAGKGRAMLLASAYPFRRIIGIELSPELCRIAAGNFGAYKNAKQRCKKLEIVCQNATHFVMPPESSVLYFYNPFDESVMGQVIANLQASLIEHPRHVFVVLYNPVLDDLVGKFDWLRLYLKNGRCSIYESIPRRQAPSSC